MKDVQNEVGNEVQNRVQNETGIEVQNGVQIGVQNKVQNEFQNAASAGEQPVIRVSALLAVDDAGRLLVVRKRGTSVFMQPGGKPEPGENAAQTLVRELAEEVGVRLNVADLEPLGTFTTDAANEAGTTLIADVFRASITQPVLAAAEIDEVRWMLPQELATARVAPLITHHMLTLMPSRASTPPQLPVPIAHPPAHTPTNTPAHTPAPAPAPAPTPAPAPAPLHATRLLP